MAEFAGDLYFCGTGIEGTTGYGTQFDFTRHWQGMLKADQSGLGIMVPVAAEIKKAVSIPVGAVTYMDPARDPEFFESLIASGELDFILMNRPLSVDYDYLHKLEEGRLDEIRPAPGACTAIGMQPMTATSLSAAAPTPPTLPLRDRPAHRQLRSRASRHGEERGSRGRPALLASRQRA